MRYQMLLQITPESALAKLDTMPRERGGSWAHGRLMAASIGAVYCHVDGNAFQASQTAGHTLFGAIASGEVRADGSGARVVVEFTFGALSARLVAAILGAMALISIPLAFLLSAYTSQQEWLWLLAILPFVGLVWWFKRAEARFVLRELASALEGDAWERAA